MSSIRHYKTKAEAIKRWYRLRYDGGKVVLDVVEAECLRAAISAMREKDAWRRNDSNFAA